MPDWTAPFHRPKMTTQEFAATKAKFVEKHGYMISVPGLSDIIHIGFETKMSPQEEAAWKARRYDLFSPERFQDIKTMKKKRKDKFLAMLASPTPSIVNNAGSIMTSIDDAQDAIGTLAVLGKILVANAPRALAKVLTGPVGWLMTAAEVLNLVQHLGYQRLPSKEGKRQKDAATKDNPKSKKYRLKKALKTRKLWPTKGAVVEALQVSDNVFGIGICLGPLVGFLIESVAGPIRRITGDRVGVKMPWQSMSDWTATAQKQSRSQLAYVGAGLQTDPDEVMLMAIASYLSSQELLTMTSAQNPFDNIDDLGTVELMAPVPTNILTLEIIEEEGLKLDDVVGWPHHNKPWVPVSDIGPEYDTPAKQFQADFMDQHLHDWYGYAYGSLTTQTIAHTFTAVEGPDNLLYDYTAQSKFAHIMLDKNAVLAKDQEPAKIQLLIAWIENLEATDQSPTWRDILEFCAANEILLYNFLANEPISLEIPLITPVRKLVTWRAR